MSNQLQHKLLNFECAPPSETWARIESALETDLSHDLTEKLYQFEAAPPQNAWEKINDRLKHSAGETKTISLFSRYHKTIRYSGAAAALIVAAVLVSLLISKKTESEIPVNGAVTTSPVYKDSAKPFDQNWQKENQKSVASSLEKNNADASVAQSQVQSNPIQKENSILPDKYMIYYDANGNAIKLPKKIFNAFVCPINEVDNIDCKKKLKKLKEKFASSALTADFNGLLEIMKNLQENQ